MRPIPRSRHLLAVMILAAVAAGSGYLAMHDSRLSDAQIHVASAAVKSHRPDLYTGDAVLGGRGLWRIHSPLLLGAMNLLLVPTAYEDLTLPFRAVAGVAVMVYLCGMYCLLYRQCRSWSISVLVAVLSVRVTETLAGGFWGVGSLASLTPAGLCLSVSPLVVLALLRYSAQWRVLLVFAFVGLLGNLHMPTAMNLAIVLLIVYLGRCRFAASAWPTAAGCVLCAILAALPYVGYFFWLRNSMAEAGTQTTWQVVCQTFQAAELSVLYPTVLESALPWGIVAVVLVVPAIAVLSQVERFRVRDLRVWIWFIIAGLLVSFGLHALSQRIGFVLKKGPPVIDFVRASSLVMLPLYILFAQALTNLFRLVRQHGAWLRWACAALAVAWLVPSDNFRVARYAMEDAATMFIAENNKPRYVQRHHERNDRRSEIAAIARWARRHSDEKSVFIADSSRFRMLARRAVFASRDDVETIYYLTPWNLKNWKDSRLERQAALLGGGSTEALQRFADEQAKQAEFKNVRQWYAIVETDLADPKAAATQPVAKESWGKYYTVYRLR